MVIGDKRKPRWCAHVLVERDLIRGGYVCIHPDDLIKTTLYIYGEYSFDDYELDYFTGFNNRWE